MARQDSILQSLRIQSRVMKALFLREMITHFGRHNIGFLWMFAEPMLFTVGITILWSFEERHHGLIPIAGFSLTGYSVIVAWRSCINRIHVALRANTGLLYHRNITVFDLAVTRGLFEFSAVTVSFFALTFVFSEFGLMRYPMDILESLGGWLLIGWFSI